MRLILFLMLAGTGIITCCKTPQKINFEPVLQGISGTVTVVSGNQMPRIGQSPATPKAFPTKVFFYEPTDITQVNRVNGSPFYTSIYTKMVSSVETDSTGAFKQALPTGNYSVFVQVNKQFYANSFDIRNNIFLVQVEEGKLTEIKIVVNNAASY